MIVTTSTAGVVVRRPGRTSAPRITCIQWGDSKHIHHENLQIWDATLTDLLYEVPVTPAGSSQFEGEAFCQGVCMCCIADTFHICIGTSTGSMHLFSLSEPKSIAQVCNSDCFYFPVVLAPCVGRCVMATQGCSCQNTNLQINWYQK